MVTSKFAIGNFLNFRSAILTRHDMVKLRTSILLFRFLFFYDLLSVLQNFFVLIQKLVSFLFKILILLKSLL